MLAEASSRRAKVYGEGSKFVYDEGELPEGLSVGAGSVMCIVRRHGITASQMPGVAEDWIVIGGGSGGGGGTVVVDSKLSDTSANPVQNKVIKAALDKKVTAVSGKGLSTNDFTAALKKKVEDTPVISLSGNVLTVAGKSFDLSSLVSGGGTATAKDYYIGFLDSRSDAFASATANDMLNVSPASDVVGNAATKTVTWDRKLMFVLTRKNAVTVQSATFRSIAGGGDQALELDLTHSDVTIDGTTYACAGKLMASANMGQDTATITFKNV